MPWREQLAPARMRRVAIVAPRSRARAALVGVAATGVFQPDEPTDDPDPGPAATVLGRIAAAAVPPALSREPIDPERLADLGAIDLLTGEADLERRLATATATERCAVIVGWTPEAGLVPLREALAALGGSVVALPLPPGASPPTQLTGEERAGRALVDTYATVPYRDLDPTIFAGFAYVAMFGMMFGDVGHGALLAGLGVAARLVDHRWLRPARRVWPIIVGAGVCAMLFGVLYGDAFGPTGLLPVVWLEPLDEPDRLLVAAVIFGAALLAVTFAIASVNRWREGGLRLTLYASSGLAGVALFAGAVLTAAGVATTSPIVRTAGLALAGLGVALTAAGLIAELGRSATALLQVLIEVFDVVLRLLTNLVSFARIAAFGLAHAAIAKVVWDATTALWGGAFGTPLSIVVFVAGNLVAFALEALVAGIQALRLEYYELFSRLFVSEGEPFRPWHPPLRSLEEGP